MVCANVYVNKGEGVVKGKDVLSAACATPEAKGLETRARADPLRITFGGNVLHQPSIRPRTAAMIPLFGHPTRAGCESAYSA
jgi:hypothetical protein